MRGFFFVALICALGASGAEAQTIARLADGRFNEVVRREAPVSARDFVGVTFESRQSAADLTQVFVHGAGEGGPVCLTIASRDGSYYARNGYELPAAQGAVRLPITTVHGGVYRRASLDTLAFVVHRGACSERAGVLLPVTFSPGAPGPGLVIAVNGGRGRASIVSGTARTPCTRIPEGQRTSFDALCRVPVTPGPNRRVEAYVERCVYGECSRSPSAVIDLR